MQVAILHNRVTPDALASDRDVLVQVEAVTAALERLGHRTVAVECDLNLLSLQQRLQALQPGVVFNLVESLDGSDSLMFLVPALLDRMHLPYTGSPTEAVWLTNHKVLAKERLCQAGLPTPVWRSGPPPAGSGVAPDCAAGAIRPGTRFVIKAVSEHASLGLDEHSLVTIADEADLQRQLIGFRKALQRPCFAEQFIAGREFNISLLAHADGCQILPPAEIDFSAFPADKPRLVGYRAKWEEDSFEYLNTPRRFDFPPSDAALLKQIGEIAAACWDLFAVRGYIRVDFRVDQDRRPWILEVNANPCLSPDAGFAAALERAGVRFDQAVARILDAALAS
ncbi:MAG: D-alanine--D-alanine ligase [Candidatus Anammoximicrobium sp.]|nr:D-alanine--D-alanine ligase [Candidatus Anammoximicrobium sp.]